MYAQWLHDPGLISIPNSGESVSSAQQRITEAIRDVALSFRGETVLVVGHKHINAILLCAVLGEPLTEFGRMIVEETVPRLLPSERIEMLCARSEGGATGRDEALLR